MVCVRNFMPDTCLPAKQIFPAPLWCSLVPCSVIRKCSGSIEYRITEHGTSEHQRGAGKICFAGRHVSGMKLRTQTMTHLSYRAAILSAAILSIVLTIGVTAPAVFAQQISNKPLMD